MRDWVNITPELRESNLARARGLSTHLEMAGYGVRPSSAATQQAIQLPDFAVNQISQRLHEEWLEWITRTGITGSPNLLSWEALATDIKDRNKEMARRSPQILLECGFEVYSLDQPLPGTLAVP